MKIHNEKQGSAEWLALRFDFCTASEASAMMCASPYVSRSQLLEMKSSPKVHVVDDAKKALFARGHESEEKARVLIENETGEDFYQIVGSIRVEGIDLLASFDGLTADGKTVFEHKLWNEKKAQSVRGGIIPESDVWQVEQQLLVSGAEKAIYVVSDGTKENWEMIEYRPDPDRRKKLIAGWHQFAADLMSYEPTEPTIKTVGDAPDTLPSLRIEATGMVTSSNLAEFKETASAVLLSINMELSSDQDFADAEKAVKWAKDVESRLDAAKKSVLAQTVDIDNVFSVIEQIKAETREKRLILEKSIKRKKEVIKEEIIAESKKKLCDYLRESGFSDEIVHENESVFADAIKGKKTLKAMKLAADDALARIKVEAAHKAEKPKSIEAFREITIEISASEEASVKAASVVGVRCVTERDMRELESVIFKIKQAMRKK